MPGLDLSSLKWPLVLRKLRRYYSSGFIRDAQGISIRAQQRNKKLLQLVLMVLTWSNMEESSESEELRYLANHLFDF